MKNEIKTARVLCRCFKKDICTLPDGFWWASLRLTNILSFRVLYTPWNLRRLRAELSIAASPHNLQKKRGTVSKVSPKVWYKRNWLAFVATEDNDTFDLLTICWLVCALGSQFCSSCHTTKGRSLCPTLWGLFRFAPVNTTFNSLFLFKWSVVKRARTMSSLKSRW